MSTDWEERLAAQQAEIERLQAQQSMAKRETNARMRNAYETIGALVDMVTTKEPFSVVELQQVGLLLWAMAVVQHIVGQDPTTRIYPNVMATAFANVLQSDLPQRTGQPIEFVCSGDDFPLTPIEATAWAIILTLLAQCQVEQSARLPAGRAPILQVEMRARSSHVLAVIVAPALSDGLDSLGGFGRDFIPLCAQSDLQASIRWERNSSAGSIFWIDAARRPGDM